MKPDGFVLVGDDSFFPGVVACVNALRFYGHKEPITVFDIGFTELQRKTLAESGEVEVADLDCTKYKLCGKGRAWESKAHALALPLYRLTTYIDSDAFPTSNVSELFKYAAAGLITGGKDGDGVTYDAAYKPYGFEQTFENKKYFSTSAFSFDRETWQPVLDRWSKLCDENGGFGESAPYQGHGDQGVLNAVVCSMGKYDQINLLDNRLWSCHWTYFSHLPKLLNQERIFLLNKCGRTQRMLHCGGAEKFWDPTHPELMKRWGPLDGYYAWLHFLFFGKIKPSATVLPEHLFRSLEQHRDWVEVLGTVKQSVRFKTTKRDAFILRNFQSPGDTLMITAAVRDMKKWYPNLLIDVRTPSPDLWEHNPHVSKLDESDASVHVVDVEYGRQSGGLIHQSNQKRDVHFLHAFIEDINFKLSLNVKLTEFKPDVHLTPQEMEERPFADDYWILISGGKSDAPTKWVPPSLWQKTVEMLPDVTFVQLGALKKNANDPNDDHTHPDIVGKNVVDRRGKTSLRDCLRWVYHSQGVLCPITFFMHAAASFNRRCVVVAGGREPPWWETYPNHDFLHTIGKLNCCMAGGCWRPLMKSDDAKTRRDQVCLAQENGVQKCMTLITPEMVVEAIKRDPTPAAVPRGEMVAGLARIKSTPMDVVAVMLDDRRVKFADEVISITRKDIVQTLDLLADMNFRDAYVFGWPMFESQATAHRLTVKLKNMKKKGRSVHFCLDALSNLPQWAEFKRTVSIVSIEEGLKQTT